MPSRSSATSRRRAWQTCSNTRYAGPGGLLADARLLPCLLSEAPRSCVTGRRRLRPLPTARSRQRARDWFANALFWRPQEPLLVNSRTLLPVFRELAPAATPDAIGHFLTPESDDDQRLVPGDEDQEWPIATPCLMWEVSELVSEAADYFRGTPQWDFGGRK